MKFGESERVKWVERDTCGELIRHFIQFLKILWLWGTSACHPFFLSFSFLFFFLVSKVLVLKNRNYNELILNF